MAQATYPSSVRAALCEPLFGLAPSGVYLAALVTKRAVCSYHTLSPLPDPHISGHRRFALCCTCRRLTPPRHYLALCSMEPGLSSPSIFCFFNKHQKKRRLSG